MNRVGCLPQISTLFIIVSHPLVLDGSAQTTSALVIILTVLVSHLSTALTTSVLTALFKPRVKICADDALVQFCPANVLHAIKRILVGVVFHKTESARCFREAIKTHDEALDFATFREERIDLLLGGVER
jgi:hypothetical protein